MNKKQRIVLVVGIVAFIVGGVAWFYSGTTSRTLIKDSSPVFPRYEFNYIEPKPINLVVVWTMVVVVTAGLLYALKSNNEPPDKK